MRLLPFIAVVVFLMASPLPGADVGAGFDPEAWEDDAQGLYAALRTIEKGDARPMVVYFYTDWCPYCRQFEKELLGTARVRAYLSETLAVRINPENGDQEREIAEYYGVNGYPAFFVQGQGSRAMTKVDRVVVRNGEPRLMTPEQFVAAVSSVASR